MGPAFHPNHPPSWPVESSHLQPTSAISNHLAHPHSLQPADILNDLTHPELLSEHFNAQPRKHMCERHPPNRRNWLLWKALRRIETNNAVKVSDSWTRVSATGSRGTAKYQNLTYTRRVGCYKQTAQDRPQLHRRFVQSGNPAPQ